MGFRTPVDIANRALQHCGAKRISNTLGFTEDSVNASECAFAYDMLRRAELRRNVWRHAIRNCVLRPIDTSTRLLAPVMWSSLTTYFSGSIVSDAQGYVWISTQPDNLGNTPGNHGYWEPYFGPMAVPPHVAGESYFAGDVVYIASGAGVNNVYMSRENSNTDTPTTTTAWDTTVTYRKNAVVTYLGTPRQSLIDLNLGQTPTASPAAWSSGTTYALANTVCGSDGLIYTSLSGGNIGNDPTSSPSFWSTAGVLCPWTTTLTRTSTSDKWLAIGAALTELGLVYPIGSGPLSSTDTRNVYRVPANYLREAAQDPKAGSHSPLGAPAGRQYEDWDFSGDYFTTSESSPIVFRFVADVVNVPKFDDMFCEGLAARVGMEVCERVTQSNAKVSTIAGMYQRFMTEARIVNAIEIGSEEAPEDDWVTCRV